MDEPPSINRTVNLNAGPGNDALEDLLLAGLSNVDETGRPRPQLAEAAPTVENGLWRVLPDGRMETTWNIRPTARWHDGTPFRAADLLFTAQVARDRDLQIRLSPILDSIEGIDRVDPEGITIRWKRSYIYADTLFTRGTLPPMPEHVLGRIYAENKGAFVQQTYWTEEFMGTGPFRLREWVRGSHALLGANDGYVLGRPRIDLIEVRFILDDSALGASILAGGIDATLGRSLTLDPAIQVRDQWAAGRLEIGYSAWLVVYPQLLTPSPLLVGDVQFRRALMQAIDRQGMVDSLQAGLTGVAHTRIHPSAPEYRDIATLVPRYEYQPRQATELLAGLGYTRGTDGLLRDRAGQPLAVEIRTDAGDDLSAKSAIAVANDWKRLGLAAEPFLTPPQLTRDDEFQATFPGFRLIRQPNDPSSLEDFHSSAAPVAENRFRGRNRPRYVNPEFDGLLGRFYATVPPRERTTILGQIEQHISDRLIMLGLYYNTEPILIANRLVNLTARNASGGTHTWNAEQWDVR